jgi:hypothetical protein
LAGFGADGPGRWAGRDVEVVRLYGDGPEVLGGDELADVLDGEVVGRAAALRNFQVSALAATVAVNRSMRTDQSRTRTGPTWRW